jgi:phytoene synthase
MGETESVLFQMAAIILGASGPESADAAGHAGIAYGVARKLGTFASDRARGRTIVPADVLARLGLTPADLFARQPDTITAGVADMVTLSRRHLSLARSEIAKLRGPAKLVFLPLAVVRPLLNRVERLAFSIGERDATISNLECLARIGASWIHFGRDSGGEED